MKRIFTFILLALLSAYAFAENRPGAITITTSAAYYKFALKRNLDGKGTPNFALAYDINKCFAIEGMVAVINAGNMRPRMSNTVHGFLYMLDGIYRFQTFLHYEPYVAFGTGLMHIKPTPYSNTQANINLGLGSQFFIGRSVALRLEARDIYTPSGGKNDYMVNLGLSFLIDTPKWKPCVQPPRKCIPETTCKGEIFYKDQKVG